MSAGLWDLAARPDAPAALALMELEMDNLRAALDWSLGVPTLVGEAPERGAGGGDPGEDQGAGGWPRGVDPRGDGTPGGASHRIAAAAAVVQPAVGALADA